MVYTPIKNIFILCIFIQVFIVNAMEERGEVLLDTKYGVEDFNFTWRVSNFSRVYRFVEARFSLNKSSTTWGIQLLSKRFIRLYIHAASKPVHVKLQYCIKTLNETFEGEKSGWFNIETGDNVLDLQNSKTAVEFENDVFEMVCKMKVFGPPETTIIRSNLPDVDMEEK